MRVPEQAFADRLFTGISEIFSPLVFHDGTNKLPKRSVLLALLKRRHLVKLGFLFELQVVLKMRRIQLVLRYGLLNGAARLLGVSAVGEATAR